MNRPFLSTIFMAAVCGLVPLALAQQVADTGPYSAPMAVIRGKPFVDVIINDKGPFRFLIDTGTSGEAIITPEVAQELNLPPLGDTKLNDATGRGEKPASIVLIDTLTVAGKDFTDVEAVIHRLPSREATCAGMLGFRLFRNVLLTMDYVHQRVTLADGHLSAKDESVLPYTVPEGIPVISMKIGDTPVEAHLDSGGAGLTLPQALASELEYSEGPMDFGTGESLATKFEVKAGKLASNVKLAGSTLEQPWVEITSALPMVNVGSVPLQYFVIAFDQRHRLVRLESPYPNIHLGVTPSPVQLLNQPTEPAEVGLVPLG